MIGSCVKLTQSTVPCEGGQHTNGTRDAKENSVVAHLLEAKVLTKAMRRGINDVRYSDKNLQQNAAVGIDVGPWVLGLALLSQDLGGNLQAYKC